MSLGSRAAKGTLWVAGGSYIIQGANFLANIALMRLLEPEHFGVLALAFFFVTLGQKLGSFGLNHALIHKQDELDKAIGTHQFMHLATSFAVLILLFLFYPLLSNRYSDLTAATVLVLAISNILQCAGHTPRIRMEKELHFAPVMKVNVAATILSDVVAIVLAFAGAGIWALIIRQIIADLVATLGYFKFLGKPFQISLDLEMVRWYFKFGAYLWLAGLATLITLRFDDFLVGTLVDAEALGYYARAYWLASLPTMMIAHVVAKVAFPVYSKVQSDRDRLSEFFFFTMRGILILTLPLSFCLAIAAPELVAVLFGEEWMPMVPLIRLLLIYASLRPLFDNTGELFTAVGRPKIAGIILLVQAAALLVFCPVFVYFKGASGAAVAVGLAMAAGVVLAYRQLPQYVTISYMGLFFAPVLSTAVGAGAVLIGMHQWTFEGTITQMLFKSFLFLAGFALCLFAIQGKRIIDESSNLLRMLKES